MRPKLLFVGSGVVVNTGNAAVFVGSGPFHADILASVDDGTVRGNHDEIVVEKKEAGFLVTIPDAKIIFLDKPVLKKQIKDHFADVVVLSNKEKKSLSILKPKLAILKGNIYDARELSKDTGVQVIAAQPEIDLFSYNALGDQKYLLQK